MATPKEYERQIRSLVPDSIDVTPSTPSESKATLTEVRNLQKRLRQVKREINLDMKAIRAAYRDKSANAAAFSSSFLQGMGKRKAAGQRRAGAKRKLATERDKVLPPYENLKLTIDDVNNQLDNAKLKLTLHVEKQKAEEQAAKQAARSKPRTTPTKAPEPVAQPQPKVQATTPATSRPQAGPVSAPLPPPSTPVHCPGCGHLAGTHGQYDKFCRECGRQLRV